MQKQTRSILYELDQLLIHKDKDKLLENRADHVIQGAINLINHIREHYTHDEALDLEKRLLNSIRTQDSSKFSRGIKRIQK